MAENIRLKVKGASGFTTYHPETNFNQVLDNEGELLSNILVDATTTQKGLVQLTTSTTSTSETTAATPKSVKDALDVAKAHTNTSLASLVDSAPETLDTLKEIATAIQATDGVVDGLISTIAAKASTVDLTTHIGKKASITEAGHVQLSNKTDGTSQILAATEKALNDVRLLIAGSANSSVKYDPSRPMNMNLDTYVNEGVYGMGTVTGIDELSWGTLVVHVSGDVINQIVHSMSGAQIYRSKRGTSAWGTWTRILDVSMKNVPLGYVGLDGAGKLPGLVTPDTMVAGTETKLVHTTDWRSHTVTNATTTWKPSLAACFANLSGIVRVSYTAGVLNNYGIGWFNIYKNGVPVGIERTINASNPQTFVEDISVAKGDIIAIYTKFHKEATSGSECTYIPESIMSVKGDVYRV